VRATDTDVTAGIDWFAELDGGERVDTRELGGEPSIQVTHARRGLDAIHRRHRGDGPAEEHRFTGAVVKERIVTVDDDQRRLVWSIVDGPYEHHNGSVQVFEGSDGRSRFVWLADLLPNEAAERTDQLMERGIQVARKTLEGRRPAP
jgi:hypothetical protein